MPIKTAAVVGQLTRTVNQRIRDAGIRHAMYMTRVRTQTAQDVLSFLNLKVLPDLTLKLQTRLINIATRGFDTNPAETTRLRQLLAATRAELEAGTRAVYDELTPALQRIAMTESQWQAAIIKATVPFHVDFVSPSLETLASAIESRPFNGKLLSTWFEDLATGTQARLSQQLTIGLTQGESVPELVARFRRQGGLQDVIRRDVESIVRTSTNHVVTQAREMTYEENATVVDQVMWVATLDTRTTLYCMSQDGTVYDINDGPRPPAHFNCRSTTVPVLKSWDELGIKGLKELPASVRASMNGEVPDSVTYPEWLAGQPEEVQNEALGPQRAEMFRKGEVTIDKFVDDKGATLTIDELRRKYGLDD